MKKMSLILLVLASMILIGPGMTSASIINPANGHYYEIIYGTGSWDSAKAFLDTYYPDWYLATITCEAEQQFIEDYVLGTNNAGEYWLGGYQDPITTTTPAANWTWVTGEVWSYTNWNSGEPNDNYGDASEQWLAIWGSGTWAWNDEWNAGNITGLIAEKGTVPEPTTMLLLASGLVGLAGLRRKLKR